MLLDKLSPGDHKLLNLVTTGPKFIKSPPPPTKKAKN